MVAGAGTTVVAGVGMEIAEAAGTVVEEDTGTAGTIVTVDARHLETFAAGAVLLGECTIAMTIAAKHPVGLLHMLEIAAGTVVPVGTTVRPAGAVEVSQVPGEADLRIVMGATRTMIAEVEP